MYQKCLFPIENLDTSVAVKMLIFLIAVSHLVLVMVILSQQMSYSWTSVSIRILSFHKTDVYELLICSVNWVRAYSNCNHPHQNLNILGIYIILINKKSYNASVPRSLKPARLELPRDTSRYGNNVVISLIRGDGCCCTGAAT